MSMAMFYRTEARRALLMAALSRDLKIIKTLQDEAARYNLLADEAEADQTKKAAS